MEHAIPPDQPAASAAADGPPVPPPVRARQKRRQRWLVAAAVAAVVMVIATPAVIAAVTWLVEDAQVETPRASDGRDTGQSQGDGADGPSAPDGSPGDGSPSDGPRSDSGPPGEQGRGPGTSPESGEVLDPPDVEALDGPDAQYGALLIDIDAAESIMMSFQSQIAATFLGAEGDGEQLAADLGDTAGEHLAQLRDLRPRLEASLDDVSAETVRASYVAHLDTWVDYMEAVEQDPRVLAREGSDVGYTVAINASADAFARTLEQQMPDDLDADVRRYATDILDRGFRGSSAPTV